MVEQRFNKVAIILSLLAVVIFMTMASVFLFKNKSLTTNYLVGAFNNKEEYDDIFSKLEKPKENVNATAGITSHHFLAKQLIADFYNKISNDKNLTIFLVSPDHFNNYFEPGVIAYTSLLDWNTPFGILGTDKNTIKTLQTNINISVNDSALGLDHGIYVQIPFIKKFFPNAKIVPLLLKNGLSYENSANLGKKLKQIYGKNSLLIVSSDFSHNATQEDAKINDTKSISALENFSKESIENITNDCRQCLATLSGFLDNSQNNFYLLNNKNSFDISGGDKKSVTSYVSGYFAKKDFVQVMFAGDLMFDRGIRYYANKNGGNDFIFSEIKDLLKENDLNVVNLEGPITDNKSVSSGTIPGSANNYSFTFDPSIAKTLFDKNIKLVNLGNNHIYNFDEAGLKSTKKYLDEANVGYFGSPDNPKSKILNIKGLKIAFVGYNEFAWPADNQASITLEEIAKAKKSADIVIVFCHWGIEYLKTPRNSDVVLAHQFIDAGADFVVGGHPHVTQTTETYNGKRIYYSLGNFIFDQYFTEDVRNGMGIILKIDKDTKKIEFSEKNFYLATGGQTIIK